MVALSIANEITAIADTSGGVVERYDYDPYGAVTVLDDDWTLDSAGGDGLSDVDNEILFAGYRHDPESALYHVRFRMYHPTLGRWLQRDRVEYIDGMNVYEYVGSDPISLVDPLGLWGDGTERALRELRKEYEEAVSRNDAMADYWGPQETLRMREALWKKYQRDITNLGKGGHSDFPGFDEFDWTKEDHGGSHPWIPWSTYRHFKSWLVPRAKLPGVGGGVTALRVDPRSSDAASNCGEAHRCVGYRVAGRRTFGRPAARPR